MLLFWWLRRDGSAREGKRSYAPSLGVSHLDNNTGEVRPMVVLRACGEGVFAFLGITLFFGAWGLEGCSRLLGQSLKRDMKPTLRLLPACLTQGQDLVAEGSQLVFKCAPSCEATPLGRINWLVCIYLRRRHEKPPSLLSPASGSGVPAILRCGPKGRHNRRKAC